MDIFNKQFKTMLALQNDINSKIDTDWVTRKRPWYRAAWVECGELMEHISFKWWKAGELDLAQARLELVDIWHFGLSAMYEASATEPHYEDSLSASDWELAVENELQCWLSSAGDLEPLRVCLENFTQQLLDRQRPFPVYQFFRLMYQLNMSWEELFRLYVAKNVLNAFRQENGYKEGFYVKMWFNEEDNVHLSRIAEALDATDPDYAKTLHTKLTRIYSTVLVHDEK